MNALRREAEELERRGMSRLDQARRVRDRILDPLQSVAKLFLDDDGRFRPGATEWLERLARDNFVSAPTTVPGDRDQSNINEGRRLLALDILKSVSLDVERLEAVNELIREIEHGR